MAGVASKLKAAGVYGFAAIGFSQTVWFGVKALQNHDPAAEVRTKAASKHGSLPRLPHACGSAG